MRLVNFQKVRGKPTRLIVEIADSPKAVSEMSKPNGYLSELIVTNAEIAIAEI